MAIIETIALSARLYTRYWRFTRFYWDDFFCVVGWAFSIPLAAQTAIAAGRHITIDSNDSNVFLSRPMTQFLFYTSLWSIKISFLIFFRRIGVSALDRLRKYWIAVSCFTIVAYGLIWLPNPLSCWTEKGVMACENDPNNEWLRPFTFIIATVFDVVTNCLSKFLLRLLAKLIPASCRNTFCDLVQHATFLTPEACALLAILTRNQHRGGRHCPFCRRIDRNERKDAGCCSAPIAHATRGRDMYVVDLLGRL